MVPWRLGADVGHDVGGTEGLEETGARVGKKVGYLSVEEPIDARRGKPHHLVEEATTRAEDRRAAARAVVDTWTASERPTKPSEYSMTTNSCGPGLRDALGPYVTLKKGAPRDWCSATT